MLKAFPSRIKKRALNLTMVAGISLLCLLTLSNFSTEPVNPGVVFEVETTYHSGSSPRVETAEMSVEGEMLKMEILPGTNADASPDTNPNAVKDEVIFRGDRREMVVVDHQHKSYSVINEAMLEELSNQLGDAKQQMMNIKIPKEVLDQMPEEERKKLEAMLKEQQSGTGQGATPNQLQSPKSEYRKTTDRANKEGYPCVKYEVLRDAEKVQELWVTDWNNVEGGGEAKEAFKKLQAFFDELMDKSDELMGGGGNLFGDGNDPLGGFTKVDGFPVVTRDFEGGDLDSESVLKSARRQRLDPDAFEPPSGYKRRTMGPR